MNIDRILFSDRKSSKHQNYKTKSDKEICESKIKSSITYDNDTLENDIVHDNLTKVTDENHENSVDEEAGKKRGNIFSINTIECDDTQNVNADKNKPAYINIGFYDTYDESSRMSSSKK